MMLFLNVPDIDWNDAVQVKKEQDRRFNTARRMIKEMETMLDQIHQRIQMVVGFENQKRGRCNWWAVIDLSGSLQGLCLRALPEKVLADVFRDFPKYILPVTLEKTSVVLPLDTRIVPSPSIKVALGNDTTYSYASHQCHNYDIDFEDLGLIQFRFDGWITFRSYGVSQTLWELAGITSVGACLIFSHNGYESYTLDKFVKHDAKNKGKNFAQFDELYIAVKELYRRCVNQIWWLEDYEVKFPHVRYEVQEFVELCSRNKDVYVFPLGCNLFEKFFYCKILYKKNNNKDS